MHAHTFSLDLSVTLFFLFEQWGGDSNWVHSARRPIVPAPGDYEDKEFFGMMIGRGNRSTRRKPAPVSLYAPQLPTDMTGREPGAAAVGSQRLTA
jgi:hypothetical protein